MSVSFRSVFIAITVSAALIVTALIVNGRRPAVEVQQPTAQLVEATGKYAECHRRETSAVVHQFEGSRQVPVGVTCLKCHRSVAGQGTACPPRVHDRQRVTAANCRQCHPTEYRQFLRSRHAAPAWAAVSGRAPSPPSRSLWPSGSSTARSPSGALGWTWKARPRDRDRCTKCHEVGQPNNDGSIGSCTACHARHSSSVELARNAREPAASATWGRIIRKSRSITSQNTVCCSTPGAFTSTWPPARGS